MSKIHASCFEWREERRFRGSDGGGGTQRHGEGQKWGMVGKAFCEVMVHLRDSTLLPLPIPIRR